MAICCVISIIVKRDEIPFAVNSNNLHCVSVLCSVDLRMAHVELHCILMYTKRKQLFSHFTGHVRTHILM